MDERQANVVDREVTFANSEQLVSTTNLDGVIQYANPQFCKVSGYSNQELQGKNHHIVRHPSMPKPAFADLWQHLKTGDHWRGMVKNRCKNGEYYWVDAYVTPIYQGSKVVGYQSVRACPDAEQKRQANALYQQINQGKMQRPWAERRALRLGLAAQAGLGLCSWLAFSAGFSVALPAALVLVLIAVLLNQELAVTPRYFAKLRARYDSVSRFIYSGKDSHAIADYHIKMEQAKVRTILGRTQDDCNDIESNADNLHQRFESVNTDIRQQACEVELIATAVTQMSSTINEVSGNVQHTADSASTVSKECANALTEMDGTVSSINQLSTQLHHSSDTAEELVREAQSINDFMGEIQGIAEQINLLALNASIEAARAGEYGRGFSVVADEVRALSSRTHASTHQIAESVATINQRLSRFSQTFKQGVDAASATLQSSASTQQYIQEISRKMKQINEMAAQSATAVEQQTLVIGELDSNINRVSLLTQDTADLTHQAEQELQEMRGSIAKLRSLPSTFA